jgi:hypothetical protein
MGEAIGETQASRTRTRQLETQASLQEGGTQAWLVGEGGAGRPARDLVYGPLLQDTVGLS